MIWLVLLHLKGKGGFRRDREEDGCSEGEMREKYEMWQRERGRTVLVFARRNFDGKAMSEQSTICQDSDFAQVVRDSA